ncbi:MAG: hypothetical protein U0L17_00220 [Acutalibacteraceae bacterium]|nr:hypothetical protein [Acutalibacteraceae bacterium]
MSGINFLIKEDITQINVYKMPAETCFLSLLFSRFFLDKIEIDMISRPLTHTFNTQLSFTINDCDLKDAVKILTELKQQYPELKFSICASNAKLSFVTDKSNKSTVAAIVLDKLCALNIEILLISSGSNELSLLVSNSAVLTAKYALEDIDIDNNTDE